MRLSPMNLIPLVFTFVCVARAADFAGPASTLSSWANSVKTLCSWANSSLEIGRGLTPQTER